MVDLTHSTGDVSKPMREAIEAMYFGYRAFTARADRILDARGLNRVHHRILYFVGAESDVSVNALLETLVVSKQALNAPLRQLIEMGLVLSRPAAGDRRVKQLRLSGAGARLEAQLTGAQVALLKAAFDKTAAKPNESPYALWLRVMQALNEAR